MSSTSTQAGVPLAQIIAELDLSVGFGPSYWGFVVSTVLFGTTIAQAYLYYSKSRDRWFLTSLVSALLVLDIVTTVLVAEAVRDYLIVNFGNPAVFLYLSKKMIGVYGITAVVTISSQLFYASRIYIVDRRNWIIPLIIAFFGVLAFACGIAATVKSSMNLLSTTLESTEFRILGGMYTLSAALCDILATISLCKFLASHESAYRGTKRVLSQLLFFTINRGVLVSLAQIGFFVTYQIIPSRTYWILFHLAVGKLHLNTLLAMLNSRSTLRARTTDTNNTIAFSTFVASLPGAGDSTEKTVSFSHNPTTMETNSSSSDEASDVSDDQVRKDSLIRAGDLESVSQRGI